MEGYAKVAQLMANQEEFSIVRRFGPLNMQKILYLQAELIHLQSDQAQLSERDALHRERQYHSKDWWSLSQGESDDDLEQWQKFVEISEKLEKYSLWLGLSQSAIC